MTHKYFRCPCDRSRCQFCSGALRFCLVCKGLQSTLTPNCCGRTLSTEEETLIHTSRIVDFQDGEWIVPHRLPRQ
jgi:hypothetical protein